MKWTCDRHAIWLNKTELRGLRAALNAAPSDGLLYKVGVSETKRQIDSALHPANRKWNELSTRAWLLIERYAEGDRAKLKAAVESGEIKTWCNCGKKTIAELTALFEGDRE